MGPSFPQEHHHCASCALDYPRLTVAWAVDRIACGPENVAALLDGMPDEVARRRANGGWSVLEYVCHLRDVYATYTIRLYRGRTEDCPALEPMFNAVRAARFGYNDLGTQHVLSELYAYGRGLRAEIAELTAADLNRPVRRHPDEQRSMLWLVRQAAHETVHHLDDMRRLAHG